MGKEETTGLLKRKWIDEKEHVFDIIRKKYVRYTPEEHVRQHLIHYLIEKKGVPKSLIAIEMTVELNGMSKRCDVVVYGKTGLPVLIAECKEGRVKISQDTFDQVARYNMSLQVKYLLVTNGEITYCCEIDYSNHSYEFLDELPEYNKMIE
ncbi:MAG: type I restriction enzyme HsdR N-terminal domain-containing protein [Bacteroidetes bacterium]|nr:type I restriction enzyme HsdR N-terminal domain-containing protein [Bacteroidota bacterium]